jgi:hypothetical protein
MDILFALVVLFGGAVLFNYYLFRGLLTELFKGCFEVHIVMEKEKLEVERQKVKQLEIIAERLIARDFQVANEE